MIDPKTITDPELRKQYEALLAENEALKTKKVKPLTFKVGEKGALSMYGMGRFPVTLYKQQWRRLLDNANLIEEALKEHDSKLKVKED